MFMMFDQQLGQEPGMMHSMNGYIFGNLMGLNVDVGTKVRWHLFGMGNERDIHTAHWHGKTVFTPMEHEDVVTLLPAISKSVDMKADNPGSWMFHCHVADHMEGGMMAFFNILLPHPPCPVDFGPGEFDTMRSAAEVVTLSSLIGWLVSDFLAGQSAFVSGPPATIKNLNPTCSVSLGFGRPL